MFWSSARPPHPFIFAPPPNDARRGISFDPERSRNRDSFGIPKLWDLVDDAAAYTGSARPSARAAVPRAPK